MKTIEEMTKDFYNETSLRVVEPLVRCTKSWLTLDDAGDSSKATDVDFEVFKGNELYMTVDKTRGDYVKLYIVTPNHQRVWSIYVARNVVYPGESYHVTWT